MDFIDFKKSYWNYYIELEKRMEETHQYVEYDVCNHKTFSSNYLMLFQTVCSEIDVVGKELAGYYARGFDSNTKSINRWWFEVQDRLPDLNRTISFSETYDVTPWADYRVESVTTQQNRNGSLIEVTNYNLAKKPDGKSYSTPSWWNAYNKVKHKRLKSDDDGINYKKANQLNLGNAFAALYLLEFEFMKDIGDLSQRITCEQSILFGMGDLEGNYIDCLFVEDETLHFSHR